MVNDYHGQRREMHRITLDGQPSKRHESAPGGPCRNGPHHLQTACAGTGDPLFLVSGTGADLRARPGPLDGPLPERFAVWSLDQRGQGRSDVPPGPYTMADYADDLAALHDTLGLPPVPRGGDSSGGMVAQHFALRHPQKVRKLVLCCIPPAAPAAPPSSARAGKAGPGSPFRCQGGCDRPPP